MARKLLSLAICCLLCTLSLGAHEPGSIEATAFLSCSQPLEELHMAIETIFPSDYTVYINCLSFDSQRSLYAGVVSGTNQSGTGGLRFDLSCSSNSIIVATPSNLPVDTIDNLIGSSTSCLSCNTSLATGPCSQLCTAAPHDGCERCYEGDSGPRCSLCIACIAMNSEACTTASNQNCDPTCGPGSGPFIINHEEHNHCVCNGSFRLTEPIPTASPEAEDIECEPGHDELELRGMCEADCNVDRGFMHNEESGVCWACGLNYCVECSSNLNKCNHCYEETVLYEGECYSCPLAAVAHEANVQEEERLHELGEQRERTIELAISLPIVVVVIIVFFVSMSIFAHHRYPHVSFHGQKRHRKPPTFDQALTPPATDDEQPQQPPVSHIWRPRPTIVLR